MKILKSAFELAVAAAKDTEVPLLLVGDKGVITEILVLPPEEADATSQYINISLGRMLSPGLIPVGMHWYGKVITACDPYLGPGCNLAEADGVWKLLDEDGCALPLDIMEDNGSAAADEEFPEEPGVF